MKTILLPFSFLIIILISIGCDKDNGPTGTGIWSCGNKILYVDKIYNTVKISDQCWFKENLDVGTMILGLDTAKDNGVIEKYCYDNNPINCETYGGLYQWDEAMQYSTTESARGICPQGWHIPTLAEFQTCSTTVNGDGNALKAIGQGAGTNTSGFSALLTGYRSHVGRFFYVTTIAEFWGSTETDSYHAYHMYLYYGGGGILITDWTFKVYGYSVRCLKD